MRMKIGEFTTAAGVKGEVSMEAGQLHIAVPGDRWVLDRDGAYRLLGSLYIFLGLEPPVLPAVLTTAATWLRTFLRRYPQLPMVVEGGQILAERLEAHARIAKQGPAEQAAWVERLLLATKGKEELIGASTPRCDWFGYDGEQGQCSNQGINRINGRDLCPEHFEIVKSKDEWKRTYIY